MDTEYSSGPDNGKTEVIAYITDVPLAYVHSTCLTEGYFIPYGLPLFRCLIKTSQGNGHQSLSTEACCQL